MNKNHGLIILIVLVTLLSGCSQWAVTPCMELTRLTPEIDPLTVEQQAALLESLDAETQRVLQVYPLLLGNSWDYQYLGFDERMEVIWHVTERVVDTRLVNGYLLSLK